MELEVNRFTKTKFRMSTYMNFRLREEYLKEIISMKNFSTTEISKLSQPPIASNYRK